MKSFFFTTVKFAPTDNKHLDKIHLRIFNFFIECLLCKSYSIGGKYVQKQYCGRLTKSLHFMYKILLFYSSPVSTHCSEKNSVL